MLKMKLTKNEALGEIVHKLERSLVEQDDLSSFPALLNGIISHRVKVGRMEPDMRYLMTPIVLKNHAKHNVL